MFPQCLIIGSVSIDIWKESHAEQTHALLKMCEEKLEEARCHQSASLIVPGT